MPFLTCYSGEYALKEYTEVKTVSFSSPPQSSRNICGGIFLYEICEIHVIYWFTNAAPPQLYLGSFFLAECSISFFSVIQLLLFLSHVLQHSAQVTCNINSHCTFFLSSFVAIDSSQVNTFQPSTVFYIETS